MAQEGFALVGACHRVGPMGWERGESLASGTGDNCISFREIASVNKFTLGEKKGQEESQSCIWRDCRHLRNRPLSGRVLALPLCMSPRTTKSSPLHCSQLKGYNKRPQATAVTCHSVLSHSLQPQLTPQRFPCCWSTVSTRTAAPRDPTGQGYTLWGPNATTPCPCSFPPICIFFRDIFSLVRDVTPSSPHCMDDSMITWKKLCQVRIPVRGACPRL